MKLDRRQIAGCDEATVAFATLDDTVASATPRRGVRSGDTCPRPSNTPQYLLDQAKRRLKPTPVTLPGMGAVEKRLRAQASGISSCWPSRRPLVISGRSWATRACPVIGHLIEVFRGGPDFVLDLYRKHGPSLHYSHNVALSQVMALGPDATQAVFSNRNKGVQRAWDPVIGPFSRAA